MMTVEEIKKAISELSPRELSILRAWFDRFMLRRDKQYHLFVTRKINKGLKEIKRGKGFSQQEVKKRLEKWMSK